MRCPIAVLLALCSLVLLTAFSLPPKPKQPGLSADMHVVGSTLWVRWSIAATPSDSLTVAVSATSQPTLKKMYTVDSKVDSTSYAKPAPGASITVSILGTNWRGTRPAAAPIVTGTYTEPDTVVSPPAVDLKFIPASYSLTPGQQTYVCVAAKYADGTYQLTTNSAPIPECQQRYAAWRPT